MEQIIVNGRVIIDKVKECKGSITGCFIGKLLVDDKLIDVTYDAINDNLVIHQWYRLSQSTIPIITELVKACFKERMISI